MRKKLIVGYCRAASFVQKRDESIDGQKQQLTKLAKKHGVTIDHFYIDGGYSGSTLQRPELKKLLRDCRAGKIKAVLVTDLDRIARYAHLVIKVLNKLKKYKVRMLANEGYGFVD